MITVRFEGGKELAAALAGLSARVSKRLQYEALEEAAAPMVKTARSMAPRRPPAPDLADNIVVQRFSPRADKWGDKEATAAVKWGPARGFIHGFWQEYGTVHHGSHPFMRPAFDQHKDKALSTISAAIWRELAGKGINRPMQSSDEPISGGPGGGLL